MYRQNGHLRLIGKVAGVHGIRGELSVYPLTNDPGRFLELEELYIATEDPAGGPPQPQQIEQARLHKGRVLVKLARFSTRTEAERLIGHEVYVARENEEELAEGEYFIDALVGLTAMSQTGEEVGSITGFDDIPGNPLLIVKLREGPEVMVPFSKHFVGDVDLGLGRVTLKDEFRGLLNPEEVRE
jgi:16S rRNA processing protein RimM